MSTNPFARHRFVTYPSLGDPATAYKVVTSAANVFRLTPSVPIQIIRWGLIATTTVNDGANGLKLTGDVRPTAGSDSSRVTGASTSVASQTGYNATGQPGFYYDTAGGSITLTASATQLVAGKFAYHDVAPQAPQSSGYYPDPDTVQASPGGVDTQLVIYPGQEFLIAVQATAPGAGAGVLFAEFLELPFQGSGYSGATQIVPAAIRPTPSDAISNGTKYFS